MTRGRISRVAAVVLGVVAAVGSSTATAEPVAEPLRVATFVPLTPQRVLDTRADAKVGNATGTAAALEVVMSGKGGLPSTGVAAVSLNVTVTEAENPTVGGGYVTVYPCGTRPDASNLNFVAGQTVPNAVIAPVSAAGTVCFYAYGATHLLADVSGYFPTGSDFTTLTPERVLDTRASGKVGSASGGGAAFELSVLGKGGLPTSGIGAVALNVTAAETENPTVGGGYVTVYPCGTRPDASNLNFVAGQTVPNLVIAPVSATGTVCFYVYGTAHLLADVSGYFPTGSGLVPLTPARLLNTRFTTKVGNAAGTGTVLELSVLGHAGLPPTGTVPVNVGPGFPLIFAGGPVIGALALNVTVTDGEDPAVGGGYVTVFPCGTRPDASNLNFVAGQTIANAVIAPVSATGRICFYVYGTANLLADVSGYLPTPNTVGFKFVDQGGLPIPSAGLLWCNRTVDPTCATGYFYPSDAAGTARLALEPTVTYRILAHVGDTGWPCPGFINPEGHTSHFGTPVEGLGDSFPALTTLTIVKPDPSAC